MTSMYDVLKASKNVPVNDIFAELWGRKLSGDYTITTYTGTLPAVLTGTKAGNLHRYKIYGNTEQTDTPTPDDPVEPAECGERTENLFDKDDPNNAGYINNQGEITGTNAYCHWLIPVTKGDVVDITKGSAGAGYGLNNGQVVVRVLKSEFPYTVPAGITHLTNNWLKSESNTSMVTKNVPIPSTYIPYGYKLPLLSDSTPVDIYIGDDTLSAEEYVDSGTGKIYRMVDDVLTPVDPPVPFPQIPTSANSTTISWAGEGLAPSQVEFEYERK